MYVYGMTTWLCRLHLNADLYIDKNSRLTSDFYNLIISSTNKISRTKNKNRQIRNLSFSWKKSLNELAGSSTSRGSHTPAGLPSTAGIPFTTGIPNTTSRTNSSNFKANYKNISVKFFLPFRARIRVNFCLRLIDDKQTFH